LWALCPVESKYRYNHRPPRNPPIWAQKAMPVALFESISEVVPLRSCPRNQMPMKIIAGIGKNRGIIKMGIKEIMVLFGNISI